MPDAPLPTITPYKIAMNLGDNASVLKGRILNKILFTVYG